MLMRRVVGTIPALFCLLALTSTTSTAVAQATLRTCASGGFGTRLDGSFRNPGLIRSPLDDGSYQVPEATVRQVFGPTGVPFSGAGAQVYVNVNGNVSFGEPVYRYTPDAIPGLSTPAVAAYFGDVDLRDHNRLLLPDIRNPGSVYLCVESDGDEGVIRSGDLIMVTWEDVVRYDASDGFNRSQTASFQVILSVPDAVCGTSPSTRGVDVEFRYAQLTWTTGDASGGSGGFGGTAATAGLDDGAGNAIALPGSGTRDVTMLVNRSNVGEPGVFRVRSWGGALSDCGNGTVDACEICDGSALASGVGCPSGYTGTPLCNNDPANAAGDGTCTLDPVPDGCIDVDECAPGGGATCSADATCMNTAGGYICECTTGTTGDGFTCHELVVTSPTAGGIVTDATPPITGTGEPGAEIIIIIDGVEAGRTAVEPDGTFSFTPPLALGEGAHTVVVIAIGAGGSTATATVDFMVDLSTIAFITSPADGTIIGDSTPRIAGRAEPGATVVIRIDGAEVATVTTNASGDWSYTTTAPLADGSHTVDITATDVSGNTATDSVTFEIDSSFPELEIVSPPDRGFTNQSAPTITGTADPDATIEITVDGVVVGTATADGSGEWSLTLTEPLADGEHTVIASTQNAAGATATDRHTFTVDTVPPALAVTSPEEGETVTDTTPAIRGTGEPGAVVEVVVDGSLIGTVIVAEDGTWTFTPADPLTNGDHTVVVTATDAAGNSTTVERELTIDAGAEPSVAVAILSPMEGQSIGIDPPTIAGTAAPGATIEITIDGELAGTVTADVEGNWSYTPSAPLGEGEHEIVVRATSPGGAESTDSVRFGVDTSTSHGDQDGDGVPDSVECPEGTDPCPDTDGDGIPDRADPDDDGDGIPTILERPDGTDRDSDGDGTPDYLDDDDDGDGIPTRDEAPGGQGRDTDGDGRPDHRDGDDDGDGIPTQTERMDGEVHGDDPDGDGIPSWLDTDSDGDGIPDAEEGRDDSDGDGIPNYLDPDDGNAPSRGGLTGGGGCSVGADGQPAAWLLALAFALFVARRRQGGA